VALRTTRLLVVACLIALTAACDDAAAPGSPAERAAPEGPISVSVALAGARWHLELAADPARRHLGMGKRSRIPEGTGILFSFLRAEPRAFVMRDCLVPIDIAYLDAEGRVVAIHTMAVEPPRRADESDIDYEERLPGYISGAPAQFAVEVAGGSFAALGLGVGDLVAFDRAAVLKHTR
jgi:uncharacterized membrane protein (UPF0127 family)